MKDAPLTNAIISSKSIGKIGGMQIALRIELSSEYRLALENILLILDSDTRCRIGVGLGVGQVWTRKLINNAKFKPIKLQHTFYKLTFLSDLLV